MKRVKRRLTTMRLRLFPFEYTENVLFVVIRFHSSLLKTVLEFSSHQVIIWDIIQIYDCLD